MFKHLCNTVSLSIKPSNFLSEDCSNTYIVVSFWIPIIHNMGSYKLYLAVIAIACIAAVQEASCSDEQVQYDDGEEVIGLEKEQEEVSEPDMEEKEEPESEMEYHQCEEYKSKIWDNAFSNKDAMDMMKLTFITAEKMGSDAVCTDTARAFINFIEVMATNSNSQYTRSMFKKLVAFIVRELNTTSDNFRETSEVFERIWTTPEIRDFIRDSVTRTNNVLKEPRMRSRLFKVIEAAMDLMSKSKDGESMKQKFKGMYRAPTKMARSAMDKVGNFFRKL